LICNITYGQHTQKSTAEENIARKYSHRSKRTGHLSKKDENRCSKFLTECHR